jgi:hypothetical protein
MAKKKKNVEKGIEISPMNPGWIKRRVPNTYADDALKRIVLFYVINTPCTVLSSSAIPLTEYGWSKDVWNKNRALSDLLFSIAGLKRGETFFAAKRTDEMKSVCKKANMTKGFHEKREVEKIVIYRQPGYNDFMSVLYHIRNAFAHGRLAMYDSAEKDVIFVLEDGIKKNGEFVVRSRMILKKSTLIKWIDILECQDNAAKKLCQSQDSKVKEQ